MVDFIFIRHRLTELRLAKEISEYQLSLELGQCKSYIQGISSGKSMPSMKQFLNICDYFEITPAEFFDERTDASLQYYQVVNKMRALDNAELEAISNLVEQILLLKSENERLKMNIDKDIPQLIQK